ncbi:MAG TPA: hypothetical protein VFC78_14610 [Tepidisphaeraceae bacterium]|nr:hypothetical protein [Tepidisphaeraceae bacterium]
MKKAKISKLDSPDAAGEFRRRRKGSRYILEETQATMLSSFTA